MIDILTFTCGPIQTNAYLVREGQDALLIDPGSPDTRLEKALTDLHLHAVVFTHGHYDHIGGGQMFIDRGIPIFCSEQAASCLTDPQKNLSVLVSGPFALSRGPDRILADGDTIKAGTMEFSVMHIPGHSPGSIGLYTDGHLFSGDVLFNRSIGRSDLPGGDMDILAASIRNKIYSLPGNTAVYPGHGPATSVGREKHSNPFVRG